MFQSIAYTTHTEVIKNLYQTVHPIKLFQMPFKNLNDLILMYIDEDTSENAIGMSQD